MWRLWRSFSEAKVVTSRAFPESFSRARDLSVFAMGFSTRLPELSFALLTLTTLVSSRAVNISNTWMLPEEGFPVFYRHFRDRISWYEADAVCQFHHANLVTADTTSQYDAIRAYLKELDVTENVWIGLSKTTENAKFSWTDFRPLSGEGHWQQPIPTGNDALCVTMDPASDFLWRPMSCGGPEVASFICELAVPSWALGPKGCLLTELPSLTVLYIPEQLALELTSDCGLDGTKRIACKGNADREEIMKQLKCAISADDFDTTHPPPQPNTASPSSISQETSEDVTTNSKTTKPWIWTSNTIDVDYGVPTRHRRETEDTLSPSSTKSTTDLSVQEEESSTSEKKLLELFVDDGEVTSASPQDDVTLDSSVKFADKSTEIKMTSQTAVHEEQPEMAGSVSVTAETKTDAAGVEDTGEYPSAINQGQLFSIIENGTMFDIIELNETSDDSKAPKTPLVQQAQTVRLQQNLSALNASSASENLYTTVVYHKEPPSEATSVTNKSPKKQFEETSTGVSNNSRKEDLSEMKDVTKKPIFPKKGTFGDKTKLMRNVNQLDDTNNNNNNKEEKTLSKEIEMFPIMTDPLAKLNRTFRKELPSMEEDDPLDEGSSYGTATLVNFTNNNRMSEESAERHHQHVEITLHDENKKNSTFIVTTKRVDRNNTTSAMPSSLSSTSEEPPRLIDPKIDFINNGNLTERNNNQSEIISQAKPEKIISKEDFVSKGLLGITVEVTTAGRGVSYDPLEPEPQAQPRPNRQRQLTRPQRRSFYPYFFSRVLG